GQAGDFALNFTGSGIELQQLTDLTNGAVQLKQNLAPILGATGSLIAWIKTVQTSTTGNHWSSPAITGSEHPGAADDISWGWLDRQGRIAISEGDAPQDTARSSIPVNDGSWHLVAMTRDSSTGLMQVYVDGFLDAT